MVCVSLFRSLFAKKSSGSNKDIGQIGEDAAYDFLKHLHYKVHDRNWRTKVGEIDIVASKDNIIVIVEVKTSKKLGDVSPELRVNKVKQNKLKQLAQLYIKSKHVSQPVRFDVIGVWWEDDIKIKHIENAFT